MWAHFRKRDLRKVSQGPLRTRSMEGGAFLTEFERESGVMVKEQTPGNIDRDS